MTEEVDLIVLRRMPEVMKTFIQMYNRFDEHRDMYELDTADKMTANDLDEAKKLLSDIYERHREIMSHSGCDLDYMPKLPEELMRCYTDDTSYRRGAEWTGLQTEDSKKDWEAEE